MSIPTPRIETSYTYTLGGHEPYPVVGNFQGIVRIHYLTVTIDEHGDVSTQVTGVKLTKTFKPKTGLWTLYPNADFLAPFIEDATARHAIRKTAE